jgi:hypothetical protein
MIFPVGGRILGIKFYISNTTWTRPENCTSIIVLAIGGGGGGYGFVTGGTHNNGASGGATSFGSAVSCGGGGGGLFNSGNGSNGSRGTVSTSSNAIAVGGNKFFNFIGFLGYGSGGMAGDSLGNRSVKRDFNGGAGGFSVCFIKENLLDSYIVTIGAGGAGGAGSAAPLTGEAGAAGALMVIEFGG